MMVTTARSSLREANLYRRGGRRAPNPAAEFGHDEGCTKNGRLGLGADLLDAELDNVDARFWLDRGVVGAEQVL